MTTGRHPVPDPPHQSVTIGDAWGVPTFYAKGAGIAMSMRLGDTTAAAFAAQLGGTQAAFVPHLSCRVVHRAASFDGAASVRLGLWNQSRPPPTPSSVLESSRSSPRISSWTRK